MIFLDSMRFMPHVEVTERPGAMVLGALGEGFKTLVQAAHDIAPDAPDPSTEAGDARPRGSLTGL